MALPSSRRSPSRRVVEMSPPICWPPAMTTAAPTLATAKPSSFREVSCSWMSVAKSAVATGIVVGTISALSDAGVRRSPRNAKPLKPRNPNAAAAVTGRQRRTGSGVRVTRATRTSNADAIANRIVESSSGGTAPRAIFAAVHCAASAIAALAYARPTTGCDPPGQRVPDAGTCRTGPFNANHSESWIAVKPGTEDLVGSSKFFFDKYSTFYMFYLGAHQMLHGTPSGDNQIQGYECLSTGTQAMPPSWTDTTDPNLDFDTQGRVYQTMLPFNSFFDATKLHPDGEIDLSFSDDLGRTWVKGNGGRPLEPSTNASAKQAGHVEDKQWVAVNHIVGNAFQDHVYAAWAVFNGSSNGQGVKVKMAVSRDRGQTFDGAVTITPPSEVGAAATFVIPQIDAAGDVYLAVVSFPPNGGTSTIYVARSMNDARTFSPFVPVTTVSSIPTAGLPNTRFRDGITEGFAATPA